MAGARQQRAGGAGGSGGHAVPPLGRRCRGGCPPLGTAQVSGGCRAGTRCSSPTGALFGAVSFWLGRATLPLAPSPQHNPSLSRHPRPQLAWLWPPHSSSAPVSAGKSSSPLLGPPAALGSGWHGGGGPRHFMAPARATESQKQLSPLCPAALGFRYPRSRPCLAPHPAARRRPMPGQARGESRSPPSSPSVGLGQCVGAMLGERGCGDGGSTAPSIAAQPPRPRAGGSPPSRATNG